jgi:hypothetical protein
MGKIIHKYGMNKQEKQNKLKMYSTYWQNQTVVCSYVRVHGNVAAGRSLAGIFCMIPGQLDRWTEKIVA